MSDLIGLGIYELVWNHPPMPEEALLARVSSDHTRRAYRLAFQRFCGFIECDPVRATPTAIANWKSELLIAYPPATAAINLQAIRQLYDEAVAQGLLTANPAATVQPPAVTPQPGAHAPPLDIAAARLGKPTTEVARHDHALSLVISETDVQVEEVAALTVADYRCEEHGAALRLRRGQSGQPVWVELPPEVRDSLDAYLNARPVADDSLLFPLAASRPLTSPSPARET